VLRRYFYIAGALSVLPLVSKYVYLERRISIMNSWSVGFDFCVMKGGWIVFIYIWLRL
jgi:hypothetical protein